MRALEAPSGNCCLVRHFRSSLTYFRIARGAKFGEEFRQILTRELPLEGTPRGLPVVLEIEEALGDSIEIREVVRCQDLPLDN